MSKKEDNELVSNRKVFHDFEILETFEAGVVLKGTEIKSLRDGGGSLKEAYITLLKGEPYLIGSHIAVYRFGNIHNHEERRNRKILLHKREIQKIKKALQEKGLAIVPLNMHLSAKGICKLSIGIAKGKKLYDKRASMKEKEEKKAIQRETKQ